MIIPGFGIIEGATKIRLWLVSKTTSPLWALLGGLLLCFACLQDRKAMAVWFTGCRDKNHLPGLVFL